MGKIRVIVGIDVDEVYVRTIKLVLKMWKKEEYYDKLIDWDFFSIVNKTERDFIETYKRMWRERKEELDIDKGINKVISISKKHNLFPIFITNQPDTDTLDYISSFLSSFNIPIVYVSDMKEKGNICSILIDDCPKLEGVKNLILIDRPWNRNIKVRYRVKDLEEASKVIDSMAPYIVREKKKNMYGRYYNR